MTMINSNDLQPTEADLARDLRADLEVCEAATPEALWAWGEDDLYEYVHAARAGWSAAIRRAVAAEAEVQTLQAMVESLSARVAAQSDLLSQRAERTAP